jgi:hypothetical protein
MRGIAKAGFLAPASVLEFTFPMLERHYLQISTSLPDRPFQLHYRYSLPVIGDVQTLGEST